MVYAEIWKNWQKLLKLISNYSKVAGYKIGYIKSQMLSYIIITNNEQVEFKLETQYHLHKYQKLKYFGTNIMKYVQEVYEKAAKRWWMNLKN